MSRVNGAILGLLWYFIFFVPHSVFATPPIVDGLVAHYPMEGNLTDIVGGNHGILREGSVVLPTGNTVKGVIGNGLYFDGIDDWGEILRNVNNSLDGTSWTVTIWYFHMESTTNDFNTLGILGPWRGTRNQMDLYFALCNDSNGGCPDENAFKFGIEGRWHSDPSKLAEIGKWYHFAATYDQLTGERVAYINGKPLMADGFTGGLSSEGPFNLASHEYNLGSRDFDEMKLDELLIYDRALSPQEIKELVGYRDIKFYGFNGLESVDELSSNGWYIRGNETESGCSVGGPDDNNFCANRVEVFTSSGVDGQVRLYSYYDKAEGIRYGGEIGSTENSLLVPRIGTLAARIRLFDTQVSYKNERKEQRHFEKRHNDASVRAFFTYYTEYRDSTGEGDKCVHLEHDFEFLGKKAAKIFGYKKRKGLEFPRLSNTTHAKFNKDTDCSYQGYETQSIGRFDARNLIDWQKYIGEFVTLVVTIDPIDEEHYKSTYYLVADDDPYQIIDSTVTRHSPNVGNLTILFNSWLMDTEKPCARGVQSCLNGIEVDWVVWTKEILPTPFHIYQLHLDAQNLDITNP